MKAKQLIKKQNVLILIGIAYAMTLFLPQLSNAMYDPKHGRWLQRDPLGVRPDVPKAVSNKSSKTVL
ncbi:MAG: hypothetical protein ACYTA5_18340 [Planctomycetota bacterium]|jgi:hypothetical protein